MDRVFAGLAACEKYPKLRPIKVNAVVLKGIGEQDVLPLAGLARRRPYVVRFIEAMPLNASRAWAREHVMTGGELRALIHAHWPIEPLERERPSAPATNWRFVDGSGRLQFGSSVTEPFCHACDRLRITADGMLRTCLFATTETDLRQPLRACTTEAQLENVIRSAVLGKHAGHGIGTDGWAYRGRLMSSRRLIRDPALRSATLKLDARAASPPRENQRRPGRDRSSTAKPTRLLLT